MSGSDQELEMKRTAIKDAYPHSDRWQAKCSKMSPQQVIAIYLRLQSQGKLG